MTYVDVPAQQVEVDGRLGNRYDLNTEEQNNRHNCQNNTAE